MCPLGNALLEWGLGTVTIVVFKPQVSVLIKIQSSLRVAMNVAFSTGHHVQTPSSGFPLSLSSRLSVPLYFSFYTLLCSLKEIINSSHHIRSTWGLCCHFALLSHVGTITCFLSQSVSPSWVGWVYPTQLWDSELAFRSSLLPSSACVWSGWVDEPPKCRLQSYNERPSGHCMGTAQSCWQSSLLK